MKSRNNFKIKEIVGKEPLIINQMNPVSNKFKLYLYKLLRVFYTSFYFYFFPLIVVYLPISRILNDIGQF
jgi:hypothetical protein